MNIDFDLMVLCVISQYFVIITHYWYFFCFRYNKFFQAYHRIWLYKGDKNERRPCSEIPEPDFSAWREWGL